MVVRAMNTDLDPELLRTVLTESAASRKALKRHAQWLEGEPLATRRALIDLARQQGAGLPEEAEAWPAKKLIRRALDRQAQAQVRLNPRRIDQGFDCAHCGAQVPLGGRTVRDHCPSCLRSLHVDVVPGDRASDCEGILDPIGAQQRAGAWVIRYRCRSCGHLQNNKAHPHDDPALLARVSALPGA